MSPEHSPRRRLPRASTVVAGVALFAALGGTATAASLINGKNIKKGTITGKQVKSSSLTGAKIKNKSLGVADLSGKAVTSLRGAAGPKGDAGPQGPAGPQGVPGVQGVQGVQGPAGIVEPVTVLVGNVNVPQNSTVPVITRPVPSGRYLVTAKANMFSAGTDSVSCQLQSVATEIDEARWKPAAASLTTPIAMQAVTPTATALLRVVCSAATDSANVSDVSLIATPIS